MADESSVKVEVVEERVPAQVAPPREPDSDTVPVKEVAVAVDQVITDPTDDLAVQVPDADSGVNPALETPIQALAEAVTPEEQIDADGGNEGDGGDAENPDAVTPETNVGGDAQPGPQRDEQV